MFLFIFANSRYEIVHACDIYEALMMLYDLAKRDNGIDKDVFFDIIKKHDVDTSVKLYNALTPEDHPNIAKVYSNLYEMYKEE